MIKLILETKVGDNYWNYQILFVYLMREQWSHHHTLYCQFHTNKRLKCVINTYIYELKRSDYRWFHLRSFSSRCRSIATVTFSPMTINSDFNSAMADNVHCQFLKDKNNIMNRYEEIKQCREDCFLRKVTATLEWTSTILVRLQDSNIPYTTPISLPQNTSTLVNIDNCPLRYIMSSLE